MAAGLRQLPQPLLEAWLLSGLLTWCLTLTPPAQGLASLPPTSALLSRTLNYKVATLAPQSLGHLPSRLVAPLASLPPPFSLDIPAASGYAL